MWPSRPYFSSGSPIWHRLTTNTMGTASPPSAIPGSHDKYQALRARGHRHARALRSVADRLLNVACAMLRDGTCFDPHRVRITTA